MRFKGTATLAVVAFLLLLTAVVRADPVTLQDLLNGGTITVGDKEFFNFTNFSSGGTGGAAGVSASDILVFPVPNPPAGEEGIRFQSALWHVLIPGQTQETAFTYSVKSTVGYLIDDISLSTSGGASYNGGWTVTETVVSAAGAINFQLTAPTGPDTVVDSVHRVFAPTEIATVKKDIALYSGTSGNASISVVDQTFSQVVPLPAAAWASFGMLGLLGIARMRKAWR